MPLASASESSHADRLLVVIGAVGGACVALARLASMDGVAGTSWLMVLLQVAVAAQGGAALLWVVRAALRALVGRATSSHAVREAYARADTATYTVFLLTLATAIGVQLVAPVVWTLLGIFVAAQLWVLRRARPLRRRDASDAQAATRAETLAASLAALCAVTGLAGFIYADTWQRALARHLGTGQESATAVVSVLLVGLCVGVVAGERLARVPRVRLPLALVALEVVIGVYGSVSLPLIERVGVAAGGSPVSSIGAITAVLAVPFILMGATLPVLVHWMAPAARGAASSVTRVCCAGAIGASAASFLCADVLYAFTGLRGATVAAVAGNLVVAVVALGIGRRRATAEMARA